MKRQLNESGIQKIADYLGMDIDLTIDESGAIVNFAVDASILRKLSDIGVVVEGKRDGFVLLHEQDDLEIADEQDQEQMDKEMDDQKVQQLAERLVPYLSEVFPSKEEINKTLNDLKDELITPDELIDNLKSQIRSVRGS